MATSLMHHGLESAAERFPDHPAVLAGDDRWTYGELDRAANALARHLGGTRRRPGRPRGGDDVEPARVRGGGPRRQQARRRAGPAQLVLEGARGRHGARPDRAPLRRGRRAGAALLAEQLGADAVLDLDDAAAAAADRPHQSAPPPARGRRARRPTTPSSSSAPGTTDRPKAVRHTHRSIDLGTAHWVTALGPRSRRPLPGGDAAVAHPRAVEPARRGRGGRHRPPAPPLRPRRGAALHPGRPDDARDGGRPDRAGHGQPPRPRGLRPLVAALRHVGRDPGHAERGRDGDGAHGRPLAPRLRHERGAGDRGQPGRRSGQRGASIRPGSRSATSRCASSTSTPGAVLPPGETSARSRSRARRPWPATCPTRRRPPPSTTAGTAPATSAGWSPRAGSTSPTAARR